MKSFLIFLLKKLIMMVFALLMNNLCKTDFTIQQLYGQWSIWYSNHPHFSGGHSQALTIFPHKKLVLSHYTHYGPILCSVQTSGRFMIDCENCDDAICNINIEWLKRSVHIDSIFGIGVNEIDKPPIPIDYYYKINLTLNILEKDAMYLSNNEDSCLHIVKSVQKNIPTSSTPLSTFIFTTILGNLIYHILHQYFKDFI